jgi:hypothetical protein
MKARVIIISAILILLFNFCHSQIPVGLKYDVNGLPLNGYFDALTYAPERKLSRVHNSDSYEIGYYYDSLNNKINGLILFENDKIFFKKNGSASRDKIKPEEIKYFVIGVDSFFTISNFYFKNRLKTDPEFVQYITEFDGYIFAKHYHFTSGLGQQYAMRPPIIETFLVKSKDSLIWENFPDNKRFKESALKYFSHIPYLKNKITSGQYSSDNMLSIIKTAEYYNKYQQSKPVYYDKYWQEVKDVERARYYAKIVDKQDSIWTFEYYSDSIKLYSVKYSSFYPNTKNGEFISYYSHGMVRQTILYENNKPQEVKTYKNGSLNNHYTITYKKTGTGEDDIDIRFSSVIDSVGNNIIQPGEQLSYNVYDDFDKVTYTHVLKNSKLITSYRLLDKDTVFQITDPNYDFKIKSLQKELDNFMYDKEYDDALSVNAQGTILISFVIDTKGYVVDSYILNKIHPGIDKLVNDFIKSLYGYKFKVYQVNKTKQFCEVVIPVEFSINRFYRTPATYYYNDMNWYWQQQQMLNNFKPPAFTMPSRF